MDWHDEVSARRKERAIRRAERVEIREKDVRRAILDVLMFLAIIFGMYLFMFLGCLWASM